MAAPKKKPKKSVKSSAKQLAYNWPLGEKQTFLLFVTIAFILTLILFSKYLFGSQLFIFDDAGSDTISIFYPNLVQAARYIREVGIPGWSFWVGIGSNTYPGFLLNPLSWVYIPMNETTIAYSIGWVQAAILFSTGLIFYRFLKEAKFSLPVCIIGALIYTFGGYLVVGSSWYVHSIAIFWMTLSFLGFELLLRKKNWWVFVIPFILMLDVRAYFLVLFMILYSIVRILDVYQFSLRELLLGYKRLLVCGIFAILIALPFMGGQWQKFAYSPRVSGKVSFSENLSSVFPFRPGSPRHDLTAFFRWLSNDALGNVNEFQGWKNYLEAPLFYMGLISVLLVFQFFALASNRRRILYGIFLGIWVFIILFPWFRFAFYGFAGDYYKGALSLFIPFTFFFIGLLGLQEIISGKKPNLIVLGISYVFLMTMIWYPWHIEKLSVSHEVMTVVTIFLTIYAIILWLIANQKMSKVILPFTLAIVGIEAILFSFPALNHRDSISKADIRNKKYHFDYSMNAVKEIKKNDAESFYRIDKTFGSVKTGYNDAMVQDYFGTKMYQSHNHKNYVRFLDEMGIIDGSQERNTRWLMGVSFNQFLHPLFSIKYLLTNGNTEEPPFSSIYSEINKIGDVHIYKNNLFIPFGIPFDHYIDYDDFKKLPSEARQGALYDGVVLEDDVHTGVQLEKVPLASITGTVNTALEKMSSLSNQSMKMDDFHQNRIKGSIEVAKPSVIFYSIPFDDGWKAKVDNVKADLWVVNLGLTGLYVKEGKHTIELNYEPPLSRMGWIGVIGAVFLGLGIRRYKGWFWK